MEQLEKEIAYASRYKQERVLLFIDLDKFKAVNDTFGHDAGDALLVMVAKRMRSELRDTDFIARMGGDEFTILLNNPERVPADVVTKRISEAIDQPFQIDGRTIDFVSASIGVKSFPKDAGTAGELIKAADGDMYREKNRSRPPTTADRGERLQVRHHA
jgi:diguanylate cyclase (GGDEF)-like protein